MTKHKFKKIYSITITLKHLKRVIKNVKKMFKIVKAGGGVVENINSEILTKRTSKICGKSLKKP